MAISESLLNPITSEEELRFRNTLLRCRQQREREAAMQPKEEEGATHSSSDERGSSITRGEPSCEEDEDEDEDDEEEEGSCSPGRAFQLPKVERIAHKVSKVVEVLKVPREIDRRLVESETAATLAGIPELKIRKKTINQITGAVTYHVLKRLGLQVPLPEVVKGLKLVDKSDSISRSSKIDNSRNHSDVIGISKLVSMIQSKPLAADQSPRATVQALTRALCQKLALGTSAENLACQYSTLASEHNALASRHNSSIVASCIFHAAKNLNLDLTLTKLSNVANISACTIRKANQALAPLLWPLVHPTEHLYTL